MCSLVCFHTFILATSCPFEQNTPPRRRLVRMGDSARIQEETTESSAWFFSMLGVHLSTVTRDLGLKSHPKDS